MHNKLEGIHKGQMKKDIQAFNIGDTIQVYLKIKEEGKIRTQMFEGTVIARQGKSATQTFTVRRISYGEGLERTFLLHSPNIDTIKVAKKGNVRRAKLYYLRKKIGKYGKVEAKDIFGPDASPRETGEGQRV